MIFGLKLSDNSLNVESSIVQTKAPQGSRFSILTLTVRNLQADTNAASKLKMRANSSTTKFGQGISLVEVFEDSNSNNSFETTDKQLAANTFNSQSGQELDLDLTDSTSLTTLNQEVRLFVVYTLADDATVGTTANLTITGMNDLTLLNDSGQTSTLENSVTVTGLETYTVTDISRELVLPDQKIVPLLKISLKMNGEDVASKKYTITVKNDSANYIENSADTDGITAAYLKLDTGLDQFTEENITTLTTIDSLIPTNNSVITFDEINTNLPNGTTVNLLLVYDIGKNIPVTTSSIIKAQITNLNITGSDSNISVDNPTSKPSIPAQSNVGGISYTDLTSIIPGNSTFGKSSTVPMLRFGLQANHTTLNITQFIIQNSNTITFRTNTDSPTNITKAYVYEDTDRDSEFDGLTSENDTLIASLNMGTGSNEANRARINISYDGNVSYTINTFLSESAEGYPNNNLRKFFVIYDTGTNLEPSSGSSKLAEASIENVIGTVNIQEKEHSLNLSGTLPISSSPTATVTLQDTNLYINTISDISPTFAVQGQEKVPMLSVILTADENISSSSLTIKNNLNSFNTNSTGVSKVWLYKDVDTNGSFTKGTDTPLAINSSLSNVSLAVLSGVPFSQGNNHLLVMYDMGQSANLNAQAQLSEIKGGEGINITFGGELPNPSSPASIVTETKRLQITTIETNATSASDLTTAFSVSIQVQNTSSSDVTVTNISPRFYLSSIGGTDITSEFSYSTTTTNLTIATSTTETVQFTVSKNARSSEGAIYLDGYLEYSVGTQNAKLDRYNQDNEWYAASSVTPRLNITSTQVSYDWNIPSYIAEMYATSGSSKTTFSNQDAVPLNSGLEVVFTNQGLNIDEGSLDIQLNGTSLTRTASLSGSSLSATTWMQPTLLSVQDSNFTYDASTGTIAIGNLGTTSGILTISANDSSGQALEAASISFTINSSIQLSNVLFYPNPFQIGSEDLLLGFNITSPATVKIYIYDLYGSLVHENTIVYTALGYQKYTINQSASFLKSGYYLCRIYAEDANGNKDHKLTRLAVY